MTHPIHKEYFNIVRNGGFSELFHKMYTETMYGLSTMEAREPKNRLLNRYRDVNPFDDTRVILKRGSVDYINANIVEVKCINRKYILTQGPLSQTVGHFWLMIWEQNSRSILMLNKIVEKSEVKCHMYWPDIPGPDHKIVLKDEGLTVELVGEMQEKQYVRRVLKLVDTESGDSREVIQYHYTNWPDFGVPKTPYEFTDFYKSVQNDGAFNPEYGPAVVHCSAGIGRSGTFCLIDAVLTMLKKDIQDVQVMSVLKEMRRYRMGLVQTPDQLDFAYKVILTGDEKIAAEMAANKILFNIATPGLKDFRSDENNDISDEDIPPPPPLRTRSLYSAHSAPTQMDDSSSSDEEVISAYYEDSSARGTPEPDYEGRTEEEIRQKITREQSSKWNPNKNERNNNSRYIFIALAISIGAIGVLYKYFF